MESEKEREHEPQIKNKQTPKSNYTSHKKICKWNKYLIPKQNMTVLGGEILFASHFEQ